MARGDLVPGGFGVRFAGALVVVLATYNPSGWSYFHWLGESLNARSAGPLHAFVGVLLAIGWSLFLVATLRSLGALGLILSCAFFATLVWWLADAGWLPEVSGETLAWVALVCLAGVLSVGMSWGHLWRRLSGRVEVDAEEE